MIDYCFYVCPLNCPKKLLLSFNLKTCQIIGPKRNAFFLRINGRTKEVEMGENLC